MRYAAVVEPGWCPTAWRSLARHALQAERHPDAIAWSDAEAPALPAGAPLADLETVAPAPHVPRAFVGLAENVLAHRSVERHDLLYRIVWRLTHGEPGLLGHPLDPQLMQAQALAQAVRRDLHKMKAFVRFRETHASPPAPAFASWFEPEHCILDLVAPFFVRRFTGMRWMIATPYRSVAWDGAALVFAPGGRPQELPRDDASEALWATYYASIFNPARLNPRMMRQEMPVKYWRNLPEVRQLPTLVREAGARVRTMAERPSSEPRKRVPAPVPAVAPAGGWASLREAARACRACPLWAPATGTVFGEGPVDARVMLVGEQPGDEEDLRGRPFVGPAGRLLDRALADLGLKRGDLYLTNAVKHFRFEQRGKVRLHQRASTAQQQACRGWLERELALVQPERVVCLGGTAAAAVLGPGAKVGALRGRWSAGPGGVPVLVTVHPSWVLRQPPATREAAFAGLRDDLAQLRSFATPEADAETDAETDAAPSAGQ